MGRIEKSIEIRAPPEKVWEMLALDKWPQWMPGWKNAEYTTEVREPKDKYRVGTSAHITEITKHDFEITESLENEKITFFSKGKGVGRSTMTLTYTLGPIEEGTKLTHAVDYDMPWGIFGKFIESFVKGLSERGVEKELEKLKGILEK